MVNSRTAIVAWCRRALRRKLKENGLRADSRAAQAYQIFVLQRWNQYADARDKARWGEAVQSVEPGGSLDVVVLPKTVTYGEDGTREPPHGIGEEQLARFRIIVPERVKPARRRSRTVKKAPQVKATPEVSIDSVVVSLPKDVRDNLQKIADTQYRTLEGQAAYYIHKAVNLADGQIIL